MKIKKILVSLIISITILTVGVNVFAVTSTKSKSTKITNNTVENEVSNETKEEENENKTKTKNTVKNEAKNEFKNEIDDETKNENKVDSKKEKETTKLKKINSDVVSAEVDEDITYKDVTINGNVFVAGSQKVTFNNVKVNGDVIVMSNEIEIIDSEVDGSLYVTVGKISIKNSKIVSSYLCGQTLNISNDVKISRELRVVGANVEINEITVGRDTYIYSENVKIGEDAEFSGKAIIKTENGEISEDAYINDLDYEEIKYVVNGENTNQRIIIYLLGKGTEIVIILIVAIFILGGFPKFSEVNSSLRLRDFFRTFFTGLLEILVIVALSIGLLFTGYGAGYGLILLNLLMVFVILGKVIFIISFAIRFSCSPEKNSKIKAFFATVLVSLVLALIEMISLLGSIGFVIILIINAILAITGFGSMFRVIFTSKKKIEVLSKIKLDAKKNKVNNIIPTEEKVKTENIETKVVTEEAVGVEELKNEIKAEIKEEINELKEECKEEKKQEEIFLDNKEKEENKEQTNEKAEEQPKPEENSDDDKKDE